MTEQIQEKSPIETASAKWPISRMVTNRLHNKPIVSAQPGSYMINTKNLKNRVRGGVVTPCAAVGEYPVVKAVASRDLRCVSPTEAIDSKIKLINLIFSKQKGRQTLEQIEANKLQQAADLAKMTKKTKEFNEAKRNRVRQSTKVLNNFIDKYDPEDQKKWIFKCHRNANKLPVDESEPYQPESFMGRQFYWRNPATDAHRQKIKIIKSARRKQKADESKFWQDRDDQYAHVYNRLKEEDAAATQRKRSCVRSAVEKKRLSEWIRLAKEKEQKKDSVLLQASIRRARAHVLNAAKKLERENLDTSKFKQSRQKSHDFKNQKYQCQAGEEKDDLDRKLEEFDEKKVLEIEISSDDWLLAAKCFSTPPNPPRGRCLSNSDEEEEDKTPWSERNELREKMMRRDRVYYTAIEKYKSDARKYVEWMKEQQFPRLAIDNVMSMAYPFAFANTNEWKEIFGDFEVQAGEDWDFNRWSMHSILNVCKKHAGGILDGRSQHYWMERIAETIYLMSVSSSWVQMVMQLKIFICELTGRAWADTLLQWVTDCAAEWSSVHDYQTQAEGEDPQKSFWTAVKLWISKGCEFISSEVFKRLLKIVAGIAALGLCKANKLHFSIQAFEQWFADGQLKKMDPVSIVVATLTAIKEFCLRGYAWFCGDTTFAELFGRQKDKYADEMAIVLGCITALEADQIDRIKDPYGEMMTEESYLLMLERVHEQTKAMSAYASDIEKRILDQKKIELMRIKARVVAYRNKMGLRIAPFAFMFYGPTSMGKTAISPYMIQAIAEANGFCTDEETVYRMNPHDKYDTNYYNWIVAVSMDDAATVKAEHEEGCLPERIMRLVNNEPVTALKADVDSKGKIYMAPKIVAITTNKPDLEAYVKLNEPIAVMRRIEAHIEVRLKPEYKEEHRDMLDRSKMNESLNDAWLFTVKHVQPIPSQEGRPTSYAMVVSCDGEGFLKDIGMDRLLKYMCAKSRVHFAHQAKFLRAQAKVHKMKLCSHDSFPEVCEDCKLLDVQSGSEYDKLRKLDKLANEYMNRAVVPDFLQVAVAKKKDEIARIQHMVHQQWEKVVNQCEGKPSRVKGSAEVAYNPDLDVQAGEAELNSPVAHNITMTDEDAKLFAQMRTKQFLISRLIPLWAYHIAVDPEQIAYYFSMNWKNKVSIIGLGLAMVIIGVISAKHWMMAVVSWTTLLLVVYIAWEARKLSSVIKKTSSSSMSLIAPLIRHKKALAIGGGIATTVVLVSSLIVAVRMYEEGKKQEHIFNKADRIVRREEEPDLDTQGGSQSIPNDEKPKDNAWVEPTLCKPKCPERLATATHKQVIEGIGKRIAYGRFSGNGQEPLHCNMMPYKGNVWLAPHHMMRKNYTRIELRRTEGNLNNNRVCCINRSSWVQVPDTDLCLVCLPEAGEVMDYSGFFPEGGYDKGATATWLCKQKDASVAVTTTTILPKQIVLRDGDHLYDYPGWEYKLDFSTTRGMCVAPLVSKGVIPHILGFHMAGKTGTVHGAAVRITQQQLLKAYRQLLGSRDNCNMEVHSEGTMNLEWAKKNVFLSNKIHDKSPFKHLVSDGTVELYGAHTGARCARVSEVVPTITSGFVEKHLGQKRMHDKPMGMNSWHPWHADAMVAVAVEDHDHDLLEMAYRDLLQKQDQVLEQDPTAKKFVKKLTLVESLSGLDGVRGVDAVKPSTSTGWPDCTKKRNVLYPLEEEHEGITRPIMMSEVYVERFNQQIETWKKGERTYCIHQMHLKDEPTKIGKTKVRVFSGCPLEFLVAVKMYFGGVLKLLLEKNFAFETAVGINATSPEWTKAAEYVKSKGEANMINGDFRHFDIKTAMIFVLLAFKLMILIAVWSGNYTEEDLTIMRGIVSELSSPVCEYNGEFVKWFMRNISGHGATVNINGLVNSLKCRYGMFAIFFALKNNHRSWLEDLCKQYPIVQDRVAGWQIAVQNMDKPQRFHDIVALLTYGDDNIMSVGDNAGWFNHTTLAFALSKIGVEYTMADKEAASVPFIHFKQCSFLKRTFVWNAKILGYMAPLETTSMYKTLHACLKSKYLTPEEQAVEGINSVVRELFQHGRYMYDEWTSNLHRVITDAGLWGYWFDRRLPTYTEMETRYIEKYDLELSDPSDMVAKNGPSVLEYDSDGCVTAASYEDACGSVSCE